MGVVFCNNEIEKVVYSGYTIDKIYACGGDLVYSASTTPPTPTGDKVRVLYRENPDGETEYGYACDGNPTLNPSDGKEGDGRLTPYITDAVIGECVTQIASSCFVRCTSLSSVTIPNTVTTIADAVFSECESLTSITIPSSVTWIGARVFQECYLLECTIPDTVTSIGSALFYASSAMTSCTIGNGVTSIPNYTFYDCRSLQTIVIGSGVTSIGQSAFSLGTSANLQSITFLSPTPPSATSASSFPSNGNYVIYVPSESVDLYKNSRDIGWYQVKNRIQPIQ